MWVGWVGLTQKSPIRWLAYIFFSFSYTLHRRSFSHPLPPLCPSLLHAISHLFISLHLIQQTALHWCYHNLAQPHHQSFLGVGCISTDCTGAARLQVPWLPLCTMRLKEAGVTPANSPHQCSKPSLTGADFPAEYRSLTQNTIYTVWVLPSSFRF